MGGSPNPQGTNTPSLGEVVSPRTAAVLDWMEERGFTEDERARVTAALEPPLISSAIPVANVDHQMTVSMDDWVLYCGWRARVPGTLRLFGVFTPLAHPPPAQ